MKSIVKLDTYFFPSMLEQAIADFVVYYNFERYHEALDNVTPADMFFGRYKEVLSQRAFVKQQTLLERRRVNLQCEVFAI
jgi:putative transposase